MADIFSDYLQKISPTGREGVAQCMSDFFLDTFKDAMEYEQVKLYRTDSEDLVLYDAWVYSNSAYKETVNKRTLLFPPTMQANIDKIFNGQYVRPQRQGGIYLITSNDKQYKEKIKSEIRYCSQTLRWYNENGVLIERPYTVYVGNGGGVDEEKNVSLLTGQYSLKLPQDSETKKLKEGDLFVIAHRSVYRLTRVINAESDNLYTFIMDSYEDNLDTTNLELGVANYTNRPQFTIEIVQNMLNILVGQTVVVNSVVKDKNGQIVNKPVTYSSDNTTIATIDQNGNLTGVSSGNVNIKVAMTDNPNVFYTFNLLVSTSIVDNFEIIFTPDRNNVRRTEELNVNTKLLNNGIDTLSTFTYSIIGGTATVTDYVFTVIDGNNFKLKCNKNGKTVIVRATSGIHTIDRTYNLIYY